MRILLTTDTVGGVWTFTQELTAGLLRRGHEVTLATFGRMPSAAQERWLDQVSREHTQTFEQMGTAVPLEWMENNSEAYECGARLLLDCAAKAGFDLLHSNQFCFGALPLDVPRLVTAHSDVLSWARECRDEPLEASTWLATYLKLVENGLRASDAVTTPTHWMLEALQALYPQLPAVQRVIPNGRSLAHASAESTRELQAVSVGRLWDEGKNVRLLADVRAPMPLLVAGDRQMESSAAPAELGAATLLGALGADELETLLRRSAIYIATSVYEPFGLAPLEAALCGCALLLHDIPSLREVWGPAALYFHDAAELSKLLTRLAASPKELRFRQETSQKHAQRYSADRMVDSYVELYCDLISGRAEQPLTRESTYVQ